jgi:CRP/FNR family transcriptional regulator, cyclic AMP receptor protein
MVRQASFEGPMTLTLTTDRKRDLIASSPLFAGVDPTAQTRIAERAIEVEYPAERVIAREGDIGTGFFVIVSGAAEVNRNGATIARLGPGEFFGELSVIDGMPRVAQVVAIEPTVCLALASWDLEAIAMDEPSVAWGLLRGLARRLRQVTEAATH